MIPPKMTMHVGDTLRETGHMRALLFGAYVLLQLHHWANGALPDDDEQLSAIARLSPQEWRKAKPVLERLFHQPGWHHGRVEEDLAAAKANYEKRAAAGAEGGKASAKAKQSSSKNLAMLQQSSSNATSSAPATYNPLPKKDSEANASGADAPIDHRKRLFNEGLAAIARLTGKGPDSCRSFLGKCLKAASDDAVTVLGLIEDAERNQVANASAWIAARLKPEDFRNGATQVRSNSSITESIRRDLLELEGSESSDLALPASSVLRISDRSVR